MLVELRVENYAVIDHVVIEFAPGLNLLTGETGAGKSILIDALALLLGEKSSSEMVRHGAEKAVVACVFDLAGEPLQRLSAILEENGISLDGEELIVRREVGANGKGRVFVNNQPATVAVLRLMAPEIASIHAQQQTILGFDASTRMELLDGYGGVDCAAVSSAFSQWRTVSARIADLQRDEQDRLRMVDLWSFQLKEIEGSRPAAGEDTALESEKRVLANAEKIYTAAMAAYDALYDAPTSAAAGLRAARKHLDELARFDERFAEQGSAIESARAAVEDVSATLRDYAGHIHASPERLAEVEDRLAALDRLKRKYGHTLDEVIAYGESLRQKLDEVENRDELLRKLGQELQAAEASYRKSATELSRQRSEAARRLEKLVEAEINGLAMKATFRIAISGDSQPAQWTARGYDQVAYLISPNPGEPLKPIEQIASGGELSRVMLALKATIEAGKAGKKSASRRALVFDEIDTGIGGQAAEAVGKKLKQLARGNQVICITHLPQIASFADQHYVIEKKTAAGRTRTSVRRLQERERTEEIARMLSGAELTDTSRKHAAAMLKSNA